MSITARSFQGSRQATVHLRARRKDGLVTARCVRHLVRPPHESSARELIVTSNEARVTCRACRIREVK